ncbi:Serine/threonine-protein phosphatase 2A regulatory subunit B'' subunit delta [Turdus rufiventris]|nr:Serine/threonine-protein phosphatase 2A regulatory subunit B'' subunit delta [Turdus rufiventris]
MKSESMRIKEISLRQDPDLRKELALLARGCDFVLPSRFKKRLKAFQQVQVQTKKEETLPPSHSQNIPTFYFPRGCPKEKVNIDAVIAKIEKTFSEFPNERATLEDMGKVAKDVVNSHPGLSFLKEASEFHSRYITTVIQRIFYTVNRSWSGKITCNELRKSNFLQNVALLEEEPDINQLTEYFSYEHFYVIYCKFWELDTDHDLYIDRKDLARHNDYAISNRMIERIFSGAVTRGRKAQKDGKISYADFVWFLISEEDKKTPTSIEYWFRCMDLDGDGALSMYELEYFYEEQCQKLENMAIEPLPFEDCLCQMLDLVKPQHEGKITLHDLKRCKLTNVFFDTFFNIEKYLDHEQKDQFSMLRDGEGESQEVSDWEKYAAEEYDILVAEEAASDQWNDGYEAELNPVDHQKASVLKYQMEKRPFFEMPSHLADVDLDEYDYDEDFE